MFLDYNQNAKDRTVAGAYSVRPTARRARVGAARLGRDRRVRAGRLHAGDDAGALRAGRRSARRHRRAARARSSALLELSARQEAKGSATRRGRRTTASRRASRRACRRPNGGVPKHPLIEIGRARQKDDALAGLERWKARHPEAAAHLRAGRRAGGRDARPLSAPGRAFASTCSTCREELRPAQEALDPDDDLPTTGAASARARRLAAPKTFSSS